MTDRSLRFAVGLAVTGAEFLQQIGQAVDLDGVARCCGTSGCGGRTRLASAIPSGLKAERLKAEIFPGRELDFENMTGLRSLKRNVDPVGTGKADDEFGKAHKFALRRGREKRGSRHDRIAV